MVGGLLYLTQTRLDIMHVLCMGARYQVDLKESNPTNVKRIFKCLKGTVDYGLWYLRNDDFMLYSYTDVDCAGDVDDQKSTSGGAFFLGKKLVSWASKKQDSVSLSTAEAKNIATASNCTQVVWMKQMLKDIRVIYDEPTIIYFDNSSAINISNNMVKHSKTKHV